MTLPPPPTAAELAARFAGLTSHPYPISELDMLFHLTAGYRAKSEQFDTVLREFDGARTRYQQAASVHGPSQAASVHERGRWWTEVTDNASRLAALLGSVGNYRLSRCSARTRLGECEFTLDAAGECTAQARHI